MEQRYSINVTGKLRDGRDAASVRADLLRLFKLSDQQADRFLSGRRFVAKANIDYAAAEKYRAAFEKAGIACCIEPAAATEDENPGNARPGPPQPAEKMHSLILTGTIAPGHGAQDVMQALAQLYKTDIEKIERLFTGKPVAIKKNLAARQALRLKSQLEATGAICEIQPPLDAQAEPLKIKQPREIPPDTTEPLEPGPAQLSHEAAQPSPPCALAESPKLLNGSAKAKAVEPQPVAPGGIQPVLPNCPKCGYQAASPNDLLLTGQGGKGECPACGIIVSKYRAAASAPQNLPQPPASAAASQPLDAASTLKAFRPSIMTTGIEVTPRFFPLAFLLLFCTPYVEIDGEVHRASWWKKCFYPLLPGPHILRVYFPYLGMTQCGLNSREITVEEGPPCSVGYFMWPWMFSPGSLKVDGINRKPEEEQEGQAAYAGFGKRLGAACIDLVLFSMCMALLGAIVQALPGGSRASGFMSFLAHVVLWLYYALFESSARQATPGKKLLRVRVTDFQGGRISFGRASLRHLARIILLPCTLFVGFFIIPFTDRRQGLHDMASSTIVIEQ